MGYDLANLGTSTKRLAEAVDCSSTARLGVRLAAVDKMGQVDDQLSKAVDALTKGLGSSFADKYLADHQKAVEPFTRLNDSLQKQRGLGLASLATFDRLGIENTQLSKAAEALSKGFGSSFADKLLADHLKATEPFTRVAEQMSAVGLGSLGKLGKLGMADSQLSKVAESLCKGLGTGLSETTLSKLKAVIEPLGRVQQKYDSLAELGKLSILETERDRFRDIPPLRMPPNPIHATNKRLDALNEKIDRLVDVQSRQSELVDKLVAVTIESAATSARSTATSLRIAFIALAVSIIAAIAQYVGALF